MGRSQDPQTGIAGRHGATNGWSTSRQRTHHARAKDVSRGMEDALPPRCAGVMRVKKTPVRCGWWLEQLSGTSVARCCGYSGFTIAAVMTLALAMAPTRSSLHSTSLSSTRWICRTRRACTARRETDPRVGRYRDHRSTRSLPPRSVRCHGGQFRHRQTSTGPGYLAASTSTSRRFFWDPSSTRPATRTQQRSRLAHAHAFRRRPRSGGPHGSTSIPSYRHAPPEFNRTLMFFPCCFARY